MTKQKKLIIFDLDGTCCNIAEDYMVFVKTEPKNWVAFQEHIPFDLEIPQTMWLLRSMMNEPDVIIVFLTARPEECRTMTEQWLADRGIMYAKMYMRTNADTRPDDIVKEELIQVIRKEWGEIFMAFEDRPHVAEMLIRNGVFVMEVGQQSELQKYLGIKFKPAIKSVLGNSLHDAGLSENDIDSLTQDILAAVLKAGGTIDDDPLNKTTSRDKTPKS